MLSSMLGKWSNKNPVMVLALMSLTGSAHAFPLLVSYFKRDWHET
jgi:hypothetical protein